MANLNLLTNGTVSSPLPAQRSVPYLTVNLRSVGLLWVGNRDNGNFSCNLKQNADKRIANKVQNVLNDKIL